MRALISVLVFTALFAVACRRDAPRTNEVVAVSASAVPDDPDDDAWRDAPEYAATLMPQDIVEPRLMNASTAEVLVRAVVTAGEIAFRLEWVDPLKNDLSNAGQFVDAAAVQIPDRIAPDLPDPQMGQAGRPVEIAYWRADWQATADGREDSLQSLFPNAAIDHYPFDAPPLEPGSPQQQEFARRYSPAETADNRRAGPRQSPVEDLLAEGPGTLSPAGNTVSRAHGVYGRQGWAVVIVRPRPAGLAPTSRTHVALAVWEGSGNEAGGRKMRSGWIPLAVREAR